MVFIIAQTAKHVNEIKERQRILHCLSFTVTDYSSLDGKVTAHTWSVGFTASPLYFVAPDS